MPNLFRFGGPPLELARSPSDFFYNVYETTDVFLLLLQCYYFVSRRVSVDVVCCVNVDGPRCFVIRSDVQLEFKVMLNV